MLSLLPVTVTVTLFLKPYVAHYLKSRYGSPVMLPQRTQLKSIVLACISKRFFPSRGKFIRTLPTTLEMKLSELDLKQHGIAVNEQHSFFLNGVFEEKIKNEMFHIVSVKRHEEKKTITEAIREYQRENGFTEMWSEEAIRRAYYDIINASKKYVSSSHNPTAHA